MADNKLYDKGYNRYGDFYQYKCECGDGETVIYSNSSGACDDCPPSGVASNLNINRARGFRNMSGNNFSARNFLIFTAIGVGAYFVYNKFFK